MVKTMIHIFERFEFDPDLESEKAKKGEKWNTITWDFRAPRVTSTHAQWDLKCDFRLPSCGTLYFPHPTDDTVATEFEYATPALAIPNYVPGIIHQQSFTDELRTEWAALPDTVDLKIGRMTLTAKKDLIDALEHSIEGRFYIYRPVVLQVAHAF
jgi:hypothetical protein